MGNVGVPGLISEAQTRTKKMARNAEKISDINVRLHRVKWVLNSILC